MKTITYRKLDIESQDLSQTITYRSGSRIFDTEKSPSQHCLYLVWKTWSVATDDLIASRKLSKSRGEKSMIQLRREIRV